MNKSPLNVDYINPFIDAVIRAFSSLSGETPVRKKISLKEALNETSGVSGIIGLAGEASGSVVLSINEDTALKIIGKITGATYYSVTTDVIDGVGELTNIISGDAKNHLSEKGYRFDISLPRVVSGRHYFTAQSHNIPCIVIEFTIPSGKFYLEVSLSKG